ncbi:MAG: protein disulfide oxidoreductase [Anaerolineae bacterium]
MALIGKEDRETIRKMFDQEFVNDVKLVMFTQEFECQFCRETRQLVEELGETSPRVHVEVYNFVTDKDKAELYGIDKIPAIAIIGTKDYGIRFYGIPSGYEFTGLIETMIAVSKGESGLSQKAKDALAKLEVPVHLQVFVTPTCPYCPSAVHLAHRMAIESEKVRADGVEVIEFPHLGQKYQVQGVPRTVINEKVHIEGAAPEGMLLEKVLEAVRAAKS